MAQDKTVAPADTGQSTALQIDNDVKAADADVKATDADVKSFGNSITALCNQLLTQAQTQATAIAKLQANIAQIQNQLTLMNQTLINAGLDANRAKAILQEAYPNA